MEYYVGMLPRSRPVLGCIGRRASRCCAVLSFFACSASQRPGSARDPSGSDTVYVSRASSGDALGRLMLRPEVCRGEDLRPEYNRLDEADLLRFLERQHGVVSVERPRTDLAYVTLANDSAVKGLRLRVAILPSADEAGRELAEAIAQHGSGSWGVHRSNLAVLGPADDAERVLSLVAATKLACWGVFTVAGRADVFVVPGGYREL